MDLQWWPAPAKLNLCLHVTGRRADGYHELQTVFQIIDLCDLLSFEIDPTGEIARVDDAAAAPGPLAAVPPEQDLVVRAARALQAASGTPLGADVPLFVRGRSAVGEGVGERLTPVDLPPRWFLVIHPGVAVPTRDIFQAPELRRDTPRCSLPELLAGPGRNDCEPVVRARVPEVALALDWLGRHAPARLTGTGACLFAAFESAAAAERIAARVPDRWRAWVVRGLATVPAPVP
jgi:4-diphosphocytidyl-2-C-methyl-D-erythritol kinase